MANVIDRITLQFRENDLIDITLLNILNSLTPKRNRSFKAKELLIEYFKINSPELYNSANEKAMNGECSIIATSPIVPINPQQVVESKNKIPNELNDSDNAPAPNENDIKDTKEEDIDDTENEVMFQVDFPS